MQVFVIGVEYSEGVAKATGKPYKIAKVHLGKKVEPVMSQSRVVKGVGYVPDEIEFLPEAYEALSTCKLPGMVDLIIEPMPGNFRRNVVTGVRKVS